jgi:hypothetical protein
MKQLLLILLLSFSAKSQCQLYYLGDDDVQKNKVDGYASSKKTAGMVMLDYTWYYTTPNGNMYQTDGTEKNTKSIKQFTPQNMPLINATNKYVYIPIASNDDDVKDLARYSPATGVNWITASGSYVKFNTIQVPGNTSLVDEIFTNYDKDAVALRQFSKNHFYVYIISDSKDKAEADLVRSYSLDMKDVTTPIDIQTEIQTFKKEVYWNGREKPTGIYETTITVHKPTATNESNYEYKVSFDLLKRKVYPYNRFFRTDKNIYSLFKVVDSTGKFTHSLFYYYDKKISSVSQSLTDLATDYDTEKIDDDIYISYKGNLWKFDETKSKYINIIEDKKSTKGWDDVQKNKRFLKVQNYYLYRKDGKLWVYNAITKATKDLGAEVLPKTYNQFKLTNTYAYSTGSSFFFTQRVNDKEVFTKYNPITEVYTPIEFPSYKKQDFEEVKNIFHYKDAFVFLTSYKGKKDNPVYKMFMYYDNEIAAAPVAKVANYKLFQEQLTTIISNPTNNFGDIIGAKSNMSFGDKYKSTQVLEGFLGGTIFDLSRTANRLRYEAETEHLSKADAYKKLEELDEAIKAMKLPFPFTRTIEMDVKTRKTIKYNFNGKMATFELDLLAQLEDTKDAYSTITIRVDKNFTKL